MALLILIVIIWIMFALARKGRRASYHEQSKKWTPSEIDEQKRQNQQEADELITVILPTIKDK